MQMGGGAKKIKSAQHFFKNHLKFATIFENILRKSWRPWNIFKEVKNFLRNKTLDMEKILKKLSKREIERNLKLFRENIHNFFFFGKFSVNIALIYKNFH